jgi:hypothetical protein
MSFEQRLGRIRKISELRNSNVICFLTSLRQGVPAQIAEDAVRVIFDHLLALPARPVERLDVFLVSNGGAGTVPWRLVALFREFAKSFGVIVPYRAYSAATLLALGANEIVMHPFGELGPIDPTVSNDFNPQDQNQRTLGISVEDVRAYISFIKDSVGITHEDELIKAVEILANKVHPLALGNVERFVSQSRLIAKKIIKTHMTTEADEHTISEIIENLASKLYFHGHPINRLEAREELRLKVLKDPPPELETEIWNLYLDFERDFQNQEFFNPAMELAKLRAPGQTHFQVVNTPQGAQQLQVPAQTIYSCDLLHVVVESTAMSDKLVTSRRYSQQLPGQPITEEITAQGWIRTLAPSTQS